MAEALTSDSVPTKNSAEWYTRTVKNILDNSISGMAVGERGTNPAEDPLHQGLGTSRMMMPNPLFVGSLGSARDGRGIPNKQPI